MTIQAILGIIVGGLIAIWAALMWLICKYDD